MCRACVNVVAVLRTRINALFRLFSRYYIGGGSGGGGGGGGNIISEGGGGEGGRVFVFFSDRPTDLLVEGEEGIVRMFAHAQCLFRSPTVL